MKPVDAISIHDQNQIPVSGKIALHYNSNDELIYISYEFKGSTKWQRVTDDAYIGGTTRDDITRTKKFWNWEVDD
jgi:hypothetical protein